MEKLEALRHLFQELSIGTYAYQSRARQMIENWLMALGKPPEDSENFSHAIRPHKAESQKITVRVKEKPPSLQVIHYPEGGMKAASLRMSAKLFQTRETQIITIEEKDLTRETIILTLEDATTDEILQHGLLSPEQLASLIASAQEIQPKLFIAMDRHLMGMEHRDGEKVPFHLIENGDDRTWDYLEETLTKAKKQY